MFTLMQFKMFLDYLGGAAEAPPSDTPRFFSSGVFLGLWWTVLIVLITIFSGQTSKFIYIDF
jgi:hypothetical protein